MDDTRKDKKSNNYNSYGGIYSKSSTSGGNEEQEFYIDIRKSMRKNAEDYYLKAKEYKRKLAKLVELEARQAKVQESLHFGAQGKANKKNHAKMLGSLPASAGYAKLLTSGNKIVLIGKNAKQNELLYSRHARQEDLLFHADIVGASLVVLKGGKSATSQEKLEAAQLSGCFSNAWKLGFAAIDVYSFLPEQVERSLAGLYVGKGSFVIIGKKEWYKKVELKLKIGYNEGKLFVYPFCSPVLLEKQLVLIPGAIEKEDFLKELAHTFNTSPDLISSLLPAGKFSIFR